MRHPRLLPAILAATALMATGAYAQAPQRPQAPAPMTPGPGATTAPAPAAPPPAVTPAPYKPVPITLPAVVPDPAFEPFRKQLLDIVQKKDRAALARLVWKDFFWVPEDTDIADKSKPGIENLAKAIGLDGPNALGWDAIAGYAVERTAMKDPQRANVICAPGEPGFDEKLADELANATKTDASDWAYPTRDGIEVRAAANANAQVIDKLGLYLVRVLPDDSPANTVMATHIKVMTPSGKVGYVPIDQVLPLIGEQMCYVKDAGVWKIAGYLGGEHGR
jgi:hypothetical protein